MNILAQAKLKLLHVATGSLLCKQQGKCKTDQSCTFLLHQLTAAAALSKEWPTLFAGSRPAGAAPAYRLCQTHSQGLNHAKPALQQGVD